MPEGKVIDLEEIILEHARIWFEDREQHTLEKKYGKLPWEKLDVFIDRSKLLIEHDEPLHAAETSATGTYEPRNTILFKSKYNNTTSSSLDYKVTTVRNTRTSVTATITKGFRFGCEFEFKIGPPFLDANLQLSSELNFEKSVQTTKEQEISWTVDTTIVVPAKTCTNVELVVKEDEYKGTFGARTYFRGKIYVDIKKDNTDLTRVIIGDLRKIFTKEKGFEVDPKEKVVYYETRGICNCRFGVEQEIVISEKPLDGKLANGRY